ncbi:hypothetical protein Mapa_003054 [Marchantia paleacea]|nr:hypothetical protein Mapa_003054 [Marchantia paleacea]
MENNRVLVQCNCQYMCSRVKPDEGFLMISERTKRKHVQVDKYGVLASEIAVERECKSICSASTRVNFVSKEGGSVVPSSTCSASHLSRDEDDRGDVRESYSQ